jgi:hypothetical protein
MHVQLSRRQFDVLRDLALAASSAGGKQKLWRPSCKARSLMVGRGRSIVS